MQNKHTNHVKQVALYYHVAYLEKQ